MANKRFAQRGKIPRIERGERLAELRKNRGYSQRDLAVIIGVNQPTVAHWESGYTFPQIGNLKKLSELYGVSIVYIRTGHEDARRNSG